MKVKAALISDEDMDKLEMPAAPWLIPCTSGEVIISIDGRLTSEGTRLEMERAKRVPNRLHGAFIKPDGDAA